MPTHPMERFAKDELYSRLRLNRCAIPASSLFPLLHTLPDTAQVFSLDAKKLQHLGLSHTQIQHLQQIQPADIERDLAWLEHPGHGIIFYDCPQYPQLLLSIDNPPYALFYIGDIDYLRQPQLAMVGSRSATVSGKQTAEQFAEYLSSSGITITSGLAHGIDTASHLGALKGLAGSVAVVANGLHTIYPSLNTPLAQQITEQGCIISESAVGVEPHKGLFPRRNRIISGLSAGTLVVEAALKSGSLITARHAMEQGREVFAIPGSIHNPLARGCHQLIKSGAKLVETAADVLEELIPLVNSDTIVHTSAPDSDVSGSTNMEAELDPAYQSLLKHMEFEPVNIDELALRCELSASEIASMLLILELQGQVISQNGLYSRTQDA